MSGFGVCLRLDVSLIFWFVFRIPLCLCEVVSTPSLPGFRCVPITPACGRGGGCSPPGGGGGAGPPPPHGGCRESDAGTGPVGVQQVALTAAFRSSSVNSRCFFVPGARSLLRTSAPRLVRDGEPDARRLSRCAWSAWATLSAWASRLCSTTAP